MMCRKNLIAWLLVLVMLVGMVPVQALAAETAQPRIDAQQIVLGEDLTMRFLATIPNPDAVMKISVAGEEVGSYPVAELTPNGDGSYEFAVELAAAQMTDIVNLELTSGEEVLLSKDYSVQRYADALLAGKYSDEIKAMVRQMLSYGAAAQTYFAYNTENPVSVDMEGEAVELPAAAETEMVAEGIVEGVAFYGASLLFRSKVAVRFYFTAPNGVAGYTFTANGEPCEVQTKGELYYVEIPSVSPADYSSVIDLTVADDSSSLHVSYSPLHYMINMNNKETTGDSLKALMQAMYNYHLAAVDYIGGDSSVEYPYYPAFTTDYAADYYIGNSTVFLGSLVATSDEIAKNAVVDVTVETLSGEASAVYTDAGDVFGWANGTVAFSGNGVVKITVNGTELQLTVENTSLDVPYQHVYPEFTANYGAGYYIGNCTVSLIDLFSCTEGIGENAVINVEVSGAAQYTAASSVMEWANGTITFTGTGEATVTVNGTALTLTVENTSLNMPYQHVTPAFTANYGAGYYIGNCTVSLGDLFSCTEGIGENAVINVEVSGAARYTAASSVMEWANGTITFTGTGEATVTVNGTALTLTVENTSLNMPYQHVTPAFTANYGAGYYIGNCTVSLIDLFSCTEGIGENAVINVEVSGAASYNPATSAMEWATSTVTFTGIGEATVTVNGTALTLTVENTSLNMPYQHVTPAFTANYGAGYYIGNCTVSLIDLFSCTEGIGENAVINVEVSGAASYNPATSAMEWATSTVTFTGTGEATVTVNGTELQLTVDNTTNDVPYLPAVTFDVKFANTDEYLYRVGNGNTVALGSLFTLASGNPTKGAVNVSVEAMDGAAVSGAYTANNSDWTKSTLQFTGTGPVKVTINDTVLLLEVVNAKNATSAASVTANNVVLLNDVSISTISVSNGYTLYGNGFTVTAPNDVLCTSVGDGFVELNNGTLDNVQIVCPNFDYSVVYQSNMKAEDNYHEGEWYGNTRSAVVVDGNSTIRNSYIHGGRAVLYVRSGHILVDNTTISGGAAANIHALSAKSLTLRDVTMIQEPNHATVHDTSVTKMGLSGLFECDSTGACTPLILEGTLIQHAWIDEGDREYVPEGLESVIGVALSKTAYLHDLDGDGTKESLNLGFTYVPQNIGDYITPNITDNRIDKSTVPYAQVDISASIAKAIVYSYQNTNGTASQFIPNENDTYAPSEQGVVAPSVSFSDTGDTRVYATSYDEVNGWSSTLTVDLDPGDYTFNFADLVAQKYGKPLSYTVAKADGTAVDAAQPIALTASSVTDYVLTITDNLIYDANGALTNESVSCTYYFTLISSKSSIPDPEAVKTDGGTPLLVVKGKNGDWSCAIPALEGITVRYYTSGSNYVDLDLATLTPSTKGRQNGTENFWEYSNGYKLKVTCGYIHESKQVYGMPVVVDNNGSYEMYFTISNTNGYVSTSTTARTVTLTYDFTDPNGKTLSFKKTWNFVYNDYKSGKQYSYNDFVVGNLTEAGGSSCFTPDTLITLADGTQKRVDELAFGDKVLSWDFFTGSYIEKNISLLVNHGAAEYDVAYTKYSDGSELKLIADHGVFDYDQNQFVYITPENVTEYVGHRFVKQNLDGGYDIVTMTEGYVAREYTEAWSVSSAVTSNVFASGLLTVAPPEDFYNWIEMDGSLHYDVEQFQQDVETYGLYTYEDFQDYVTYEQFIDWNGAYLKIPVEKGLFTFEYILELIELYKGWMPQA